MALLNLLMPHAAMIAAHPVYRMGITQLRRGCTLQRMILYSVRSFLMVSVPLAVIWLLTVWQRIEDTQNTPYTSGMAASNASGGIIVWLMVSGLVGATLLDLSAMSGAIHSINTERRLSRWDMLRLTPLNRRTVIIVKHALAQMQSWRLVSVIMGLRLTSLLLLVLHVFFVPYGIPQQTAARNLLDELAYAPFETIGYLIAAGLLALVFLLEPLWRVRTMTAFGLLVSARVSSGPLSVLGGLFAVILLWFGQFLLLTLALVGVGILYDLLDYDPAMLALIVLNMVIAISLVAYGWYRLLTSWSLHLTVRAAFKE